MQQLHVDFTMGVAYALSNRAEPRRPSAFGDRVARAIDNLRENNLLFAPVALSVAVLGASTGLTQTGALVYGIGRVVHAASYLAGITVIRSLGWAAGVAGIAMMVFSLVGGASA